MEDVVTPLRERRQSPAGHQQPASPAAAPVPLLQKVFSFPVMLASVLVVLAMLTVRARFDDPDMWWHLKTGEIIWTTHSIPVVDVFSYTTNHQAYTPQEWLAQLSIYSAYKWGGLSGMMLWMCFFTSAFLISGYILCSLYSRNAKVAFIGALAFWFFGTIAYSVRPQMIGYLLLVVELLLIHLGRTRNPRWLLCLPILFAIWINCHGSFFLGLLVAGVFLFSSFFNFELGALVSTAWVPRCRRIFAVSLVLSAAALFLNPSGIRQIIYPVDTMLHQPIGVANSEEWQATQLTDSRGIILLAVVLCIFLLAVICKSELYWDELILIGLATWLGLGHERMLIVFGVLAAPVLCRQLSNMWEGYDAAEDRILPNAVMVGLSILVVFFSFPNLQNLEAQVQAGSPVSAVNFIRGSHLSGPMLNDYVYGGYLIWAAPEHPVFVDGRSDVYEWSGVLSQFGIWATLQGDPNALLEKYKVNFCLLTSHSPMAHVLPLMPGWKLVYSDRNSVIFARTVPAAGAE